MTPNQTLIRCPLCGHLHIDAVGGHPAFVCVMDGCPCSELPGTAGKVAAGWRPRAIRFGIAERLARLEVRPRGAATFAVLFLLWGLLGGLEAGQ